MTNAEKQLDGYFARYEPETVKLGKALRAKLRARLPGLFEIVYLYERQNALVISYSPTERGFEGVCSISLHPSSVKLGFGQGAQLSKSDLTRLLRGQGKMVRYVELRTVADFNSSEVEALIAAAVKLAKLRLDPNAKGGLIIKAEEQKRRARRATKAKAGAPRQTLPGST